MKKLTVFRTNISPYQSPDFAQREEAALNAIGVKYTLNEDEANVLITNTHTDLTKHNLNQIKLIIHPNSGYDNFEVEQINNLKFPLIIGNPVRAPGVANYILSAFFDSIARIPNQETWSKLRTWDRPLSTSLNVQLIGMGHIGKIVHQSLAHLTKNIFVYDPFKDLYDLRLEEADVIIFACGLNSSNHMMLDEQKMSLLKDNVIIINAARGGLIDNEALLKFAKQHKNMQAYLDVFNREPLDLTPFKQSNIVTSSHIAGCSVELDDRLIDYEVAVLKRFLELNEQEFREEFFDVDLKNKIVNGELI